MQVGLLQVEKVRKVAGCRRRRMVLCVSRLPVCLWAIAQKGNRRPGQVRAVIPASTRPASLLSLLDGDRRLRNAYALVTF